MIYKFVSTEEHVKLNRSFRDTLALDRTRRANHRTILAFIVTSLHILALGITFDKVKEFEKLRWMAIPLFCLAGLIFILGVIAYFKVRRDVDRAYGRPPSSLAGKGISWFSFLPLQVQDIEI